MGLTATADSTSEWREVGAQVTGILTIAAAGKQKTPLQAAAGLADYPSDLISQVKVVAGACNQRYLRLSQTALPC